MAQYYDNFNGATVGAGHPDFSLLWGDLTISTESTSILAGSDAHVLLDHVTGSFVRSSVSWDKGTTSGATTLRALVEFRVHGAVTGSISGAMLSATGNNSTRTGYVQWYRFDYGLSRYNNGSDSVVASSTIPESAGDLVQKYVEIYRNGDLIELRSWDYSGGSRPATPDISYTDPSPLPVAGAFGLSHLTSSNNTGFKGMRIYEIAASTDGDPVPTEPVGSLSLASVPATAFPDQSRTVTGTGFGATQGTGGLTIGGVAQTVTAWSDTSITFTAVLGTNNYGTGKTLEVTTDAATPVSDTIELVADTANGFGYVDMSSPNTTDESSVAFGATPTVVTGDQFEWEDFNNLGNLTVDAQGFVSNVDTAGTFRGRFWDATDSTWGTVETFNATIPVGAPAFAPDVGIILKTDTTGTIPFSYIGGDADSFEHSTDGGATWNTVTSPISRTGLAQETTYSGLIRAVNTGGNGPTASYSFTTNAAGEVDNWPFGKGINPTATKNWEWGKRHPKTGMRVRVYK